MFCPCFERINKKLKRGKKKCMGGREGARYRRGEKGKTGGRGRGEEVAILNFEEALSRNTKGLKRKAWGEGDEGNEEEGKEELFWSCFVREGRVMHHK